MLVPVCDHQRFPGLKIKRPGLLRAAGRPEDGGKVDHRGVHDLHRTSHCAGSFADLDAEVLGDGELTHRPTIVDEVGCGPQRVSVVWAEVVAVSLDDLFAPLKRVPVVAGLA